MNKLTSNNKVDGTSTLTASEWNDSVNKINEIIDAVDNILTPETPAGSDSPLIVEQDATDTNKRVIKVDNVFVGELTNKGDKGVNVNLSGNNNINIEPRPALGTGEGKNNATDENRKGGNIALKPGDDIELWAHKRGSSKNDEVSIKILTEVPKTSDPTKTDEVPAKLQLNTGDIVLTSKDKTKDSDVMNITVNRAKNTRGYLKVRAQAIDLRSESHGGIALQPKGTDNGTDVSITVYDSIRDTSSIDDGSSTNIEISSIIRDMNKDYLNDTSDLYLCFTTLQDTGTGVSIQPNDIVGSDWDVYMWLRVDDEYVMGADAFTSGNVSTGKKISTSYKFTTEERNALLNDHLTECRIVFDLPNNTTPSYMLHGTVYGYLCSSRTATATVKHENKIKFEHGGGDGLEFGTFNTEKTSIFTDEYRFNKDGVILLASRNKVARQITDNKRDSSDKTTWYTYEKQQDDFYDIIDSNDPDDITWRDLIKFVAWAKNNSYGPWASNS